DPVAEAPVGVGVRLADQLVVRPEEAQRDPPVAVRRGQAVARAIGAATRRGVTDRPGECPGLRSGDAARALQAGSNRWVAGPGVLADRDRLDLLRGRDGAGRGD